MVFHGPDYSVSQEVVVSDLEEHAPVGPALATAPHNLFDLISKSQFHKLQVIVPLACPHKFIHPLFEVSSGQVRNLDLQVLVDFRDGKLVEVSPTHRTLPVEVEDLQVARKAEKVLARHAHRLRTQLVADRASVFFSL